MVFFVCMARFRTQSEVNGHNIQNHEKQLLNNSCSISFIFHILNDPCGFHKLNCTRIYTLWIRVNSVRGKMCHQTMATYSTKGSNRWKTYKHNEIWMILGRNYTGIKRIHFIWAIMFLQHINASIPKILGKFWNNPFFHIFRCVYIPSYSSSPFSSYSSSPFSMLFLS